MKYTILAALLAVTLGVSACAGTMPAPAKYADCKSGATAYWNVAPQADIGNPGNPGTKCFSGS